LSLGAGSVYFSVSSYFGTALDILPAQPATVAGLINMGANLGGVISPTLTPWIAGRYGWEPALWVTAGSALLSAILWMFTRPKMFLLLYSN
jgi:MFS transporter, ACS family, glucarate transporter